MTTTPVRPGRSDRPGRRGRRWLGPVVWSGLSQAMSSVTNFGLVAALTVSVETAELGRLSAVLAVYLLALASCRSLFTESMVAAGRAGDTWRWAIRRVVATGLVSMAVAAVVGVVVGLGPLVLVLLVAAFPPLLVQDAWRYRAWAQGRPSRAVALDVSWAVISMLAVAVVAIFIRSTASTASIGPAAIVGSWALGGAGSAVLGPVLVGSTTVRPWPDRRRSGSGGQAEPAEAEAAVADRSGSGQHRELAWSQTLASLSFNLGPLVLATLLSPTLAGAAKALLLPFAPLLSLAAGVRLVTLPALTRWAKSSTGPVGRSPALAQAGLAAAATTPLAVVMALAASALPSSVDAIDVVVPFLWAGVVLCVLFIVAQLLADGVALGPGRAAAVRVRLLATAIEWFGLLLGAWIGGVAGLVRGWTAGLAVAVVVWAVALLRPARPDRAA